MAPVNCSLYHLLSIIILVVLLNLSIIAHADFHDVNPTRPVLVTSATGQFAAMIGGEKDILYSTNFGTDWWTRLEAPINGEWTALSMSSDGKNLVAAQYFANGSTPTDDETFFNNFLYLSNNSSESWSLLACFKNDTRINAIAMSDSAQYLYLLTASEVHISSDFGQTWQTKQLFSTSLPQPIIVPDQIFLDCSANGQYVYLLQRHQINVIDDQFEDEKRHLMKFSMDYGQSWSDFKVNGECRPENNCDWTSLVVHNDGIASLTTSTGDIYRTVLYSLNSQVIMLQLTFTSDLTLNSKSTQSIYSAVSKYNQNVQLVVRNYISGDNLISVSKDGGETWIRFFTPLQFIFNLRIDTTGNYIVGVMSNGSIGTTHVANTACAQLSKRHLRGDSSAAQNEPCFLN